MLIYTVAMQIAKNILVKLSLTALCNCMNCSFTAVIHVNNKTKATLMNKEATTTKKTLVSKIRNLRMSLQAKISELESYGVDTTVIKNKVDATKKSSSATCG